MRQIVFHMLSSNMSVRPRASVMFNKHFYSANRKHKLIFTNWKLSVPYFSFSMCA